jgi:hypothetical protein
MVSVRVKRLRMSAARGSWLPSGWVVNLEERWVNMWYRGSCAEEEKARRIAGATAARPTHCQRNLVLLGRKLLTMAFVCISV